MRRSPDRAGSPAEPGPSPGRPESDASPAPVLVDARDLALTGDRGWVYRDVALALPAHGLAVVTGEAGSGRTSLLLTLAGRMRPTSGTLAVAGRNGPAAIRCVAALGEIQGVSELDDALTVAEHVFERRHLRAELLPRRRARRAEDVRAVLAPVGLDLAPDALIGDLPPYERRLFGAALALTDRPLLLVLDDADRGMRAGHREAFWARLRALTRDPGVTIVASRVDAAPGLADVEVAL